MEELIEQLKRIATALEDANLLNEEWIKRNREWRQENVEDSNRSYFLQKDWVEWNKQQKEVERETAARQRKEDVARLEQWRHEESEKALNYAKERDGQLIRTYAEHLLPPHDSGTTLC